MFLAAYGQGRAGDLLRVWHLGRRELLVSPMCRTGPVFHPDGRRLLFSAMEGGIAVWDCLLRRFVRRLPLDFMPNYTALDPEGRWIAVNNTDLAAPRVAVLDLEAGTVLADWRGQVGNGAMAWMLMGSCLPSAASVTTIAPTSGTSAAGNFHRYFRGTPARSSARSCALGLPAGHRKLGRNDPFLGRGLGRTPGNRAWLVWRVHA